MKVLSGAVGVREMARFAREAKLRYGDVGWVLRVLHGIARGLDAIHAEAIIHRDLKPANVLIREDASGVPIDVKITDFGISNSSVTSAETPPPRSLSTRPAPPPQGAPTGEDGYRPEDESPTMEFAAGTPSAAPAPDREPAPLTQTGTVLGTPFYMAPELLRDPRSAATPSDIYSFEVLAFELIYGRRPFTEP